MQNKRDEKQVISKINKRIFNDGVAIRMDMILS